MAEFKIIETQEQLDAIIGERLKRERETATKRYEGWISPEDLQKLKDTHAAEVKKLQDAAADTEQRLADKDKEIAESAKYKTDLEKTRIALAAGLKIDYADRLRGETAEEWKADAELLAKDFAASHVSVPLGSSEPKITESNDDKNSIARAKFAEWMEKQTS